MEMAEIGSEELDQIAGGVVSVTSIAVGIAVGAAAGIAASAAVGVAAIAVTTSVTGSGWWRWVGALLAALEDAASYLPRVKRPFPERDSQAHTCKIRNVFQQPKADIAGCNTPPVRSASNHGSVKDFTKL